MKILRDPTGLLHIATPHTKYDTPAYRMSMCEFLDGETYWRGSLLVPTANAIPTCLWCVAAMRVE